MFIPKKGLWVFATALSLMAALGAGTGYLLGRGQIRQAAQAKLAQSSIELEQELKLVSKEQHSVLDALKASPYLPCSEAEVAWFRQLIFHAVRLKDAGRMHDGKIECSAILGRENLPLTQFKPSFMSSDGTKGYIDLPPYFSGEAQVYSRQDGGFYVVEDPNYSLYLQGLKKNSEISSFATAHPMGGPSTSLAHRLPGAVIDRPWQGSVGDTLYATRCRSGNFPTCITSYGSFSVALTAGRGEVLLYTLLGALTGALLGLTYILVYQSSRNMSQQLRRAIRRDRLRLVYQPIVDLASGRIVGAEALARWTDEDGFAVSPEVFVHIAEERGFVGDLTRLVVRHALRDFSEILRSNPDFRLNINATAADLADAKFLPMLEHFLAGAEVAAHSLAIEVTESSTANKQTAREAIHELRRRGHSVQIDDFGTGHSSLAYLKDLDVDGIKIDKAFTQAIGTKAVTEGILPQLLAMAHKLNLQVIVEGIETQQQADYFVGSEKPVGGQGWLFGRPMAASEFYGIFVKDKENVRSLAGAA
jgi:sensor c-di-GMP phosphodiesterase-like protein